MRETGGRIVLMDFGAGHDLALAPARDGDLTGTPLYLAPEVLAGGAASRASDVYALGVLLFHLLTGTHPVTGRTLDDVRHGHRAASGAACTRMRPGLPASMTAIVERAMAMDPSLRERARVRAGAGTPRPVGSRPAESPRWRWTRSGLCGVIAASIAGGAVDSGQPARAVVPFERRDSVLIAAFDNHTGERELDRRRRTRAPVRAVNSRFVTVLSPNRIDDVLRIIKRTQPTGTVTMTVARDGAA